MEFSRFKQSLNFYNIYRGALILLILIILGVSVFAISFTIVSNSYESDEESDYNNYSNADNYIQKDSYYNTNTLHEHTQTITQNEFILTDYNGQLTVFKTGEFSPYITLDVYTKSLPYLDQQDILEGIIIIGEDNLYSIIQDFDS